MEVDKAEGNFHRWHRLGDSTSTIGNRIQENDQSREKKSCTLSQKFLTLARHLGEFLRLPNSVVQPVEVCRVPNTDFGRGSDARLINNACCVT